MVIFDNHLKIKLLMVNVKKNKENSTGRNVEFKIPRAELVRQIKKGVHPDLHIRLINGVETPCSNPNKSKKDNLG